MDLIRSIFCIHTEERIYKDRESINVNYTKQHIIVNFG